MDNVTRTYIVYDIFIIPTEDIHENKRLRLQKPVWILKKYKNINPGWILEKSHHVLWNLDELIKSYKAKCTTWAFRLPPVLIRVKTLKTGLRNFCKYFHSILTAIWHANKFIMFSQPLKFKMLLLSSSHWYFKKDISKIIWKSILPFPYFLHKRATLRVSILKLFVSYIMIRILQI